MAFFRNKKVEIYYEVKGSGPHLILLSGLASDSQSWSTVMNKLAKHFTLIMPDNRGCGRTHCPPDAITIQGMADDTVALMDHLGIQNAHLAGHSMGGFAAQQICVDHPGRINKLVLAATSTQMNKRNHALLTDLAKYRENNMELKAWFRYFYYWVFTRKFFDNTRMLDLSLHYAMSYPHPQSALQFKKQVEALNSFDISAQLNEIDQQTLIICGSEDILFWPPESIRRLSILPHAKIKMIENAAHALYVEQPHAFVKEVSEFLNRG